MPNAFSELLQCATVKVLIRGKAVDRKSETAKILNTQNDDYVHKRLRLVRA